MPRKSMNPHLKTGTILLTYRAPILFTDKDVFRPLTSRPLLFPQRGLLDHQVLVSSFSDIFDFKNSPHSFDTFGACLRDIALVVSSRHERTPFLELPVSMRPFLSKLGIFPKETKLSLKLSVFAEKGRASDFYSKYGYTLEELEVIREDTEHPLYKDTNAILEGFEQLERLVTVTQKAFVYSVVRNDSFVNMSYEDIFKNEDGKERDRYIFYSIPYDVYANLRLVDYQLFEHSFKPHPVAQEALDSLTDEEHELLHTQLTTASLTPRRHHLYSAIIEPSPYSSRNGVKVNYFDARMLSDYFSFDPEEPWELNPSKGNPKDWRTGEYFLKTFLKEYDSSSLLPLPLPFNIFVPQGLSIRVPPAPKI